MCVQKGHFESIRWPELVPSEIGLQDRKLQSSDIFGNHKRLRESTQQSIVFAKHGHTLDDLDITQDIPAQCLQLRTDSVKFSIGDTFRGSYMKGGHQRRASGI